MTENKNGFRPLTKASAMYAVTMYLLEEGRIPKDFDFDNDSLDMNAVETFKPEEDSWELDEENPSFLVRWSDDGDSYTYAVTTDLLDDGSQPVFIYEIEERDAKCYERSEL